MTKQAVKTRVLLTGVFDPTAPTAIDRRMEFAFGADGQNFWERFFLCNEVHPNDRIVYLFTEHQLHLLYNWLTGKYESGGKEVRINLDFSRQFFFNDIYDDTVLKNRMKDAFGQDGSCFWERFFLCEERHHGDKIIYLFTQSHLKALHNWLKEQAINLGKEDIEKNLSLSGQNLFNNSLQKGRFKYGYYKLCACYIFFSGYDPDIVSTFCFSWSPNVVETNGWDNFVDEKFMERLSPGAAGQSDPRQITNGLGKIMAKIAEKILGPRNRFSIKWLFYLGHKITAKSPRYIKYCAEIDPDCPLVALIPPAPLGSQP